MSSDKGQMKDEDTVTLPDVEEGNEVKHSHDGVEEGVNIRVYTCVQFVLKLMISYSKHMQMTGYLCKVKFKSKSS